MATDNPRGFVESRSLDGNNATRTRTFEVATAHNTEIFPGDPVFLNLTTGKAQVWTAASTRPILGVIRSCLDINRRPLTFSQPTRGPSLPSSTPGFVEVNDNPNTVYVVQGDATAAITDIGKFATFTAGSPSTAAARSGYQILIAETTISAMAGLRPFQVVGLAPNNLGRNYSDNQDLEVIIARHQWRTPDGTTGS